MIKRWFDSLVNRAVLLVVIFAGVSVLAITAIGTSLSRAELERMARSQVETTSALAARELDWKLSQRLDILTLLAEGAPASEVRLANGAMALLRSNRAVLQLFDATFVFSGTGELLAGTPADVFKPGFMATERPYFREVSRRLSPIISEPYQTALDGRPGVMMAVPLFDLNGRFIGMIGGLIFLDGGNFMREFADIRVGQTGFLRLITREGVILVDGSDDNRVMSTAGNNTPSLAQAMDGFEGTVRDHRGSGQDAIVAYRQMAQAPWFVAAVWPSKEAFLPANRLRDSFLLTLLGVSLVLAPLAFWIFHRLMMPLRTLGQQIYQRHTGERDAPVSEIGGAEIRNVARIFNTVRQERDDIFRSLAEREAFFRSLTQHSPVGIVHTDILGRIEFVNPAFLELVGRPESDLLHRPLVGFLASDDRDKALSGWRSALTRRKTFRSRLRVLSARAAGFVWVDALTTVIELPDKAIGAITVARDITREMRFEQALREEQQRADSILDVLQEGVLMVDTGGAIRYANDAAGALLELEDDCTGEDFFEAIRVLDDGEPVTREEFLTSDAMDSRYVTLENRSGRLFDIDLTMLHLRRGEPNERLVFVLRDDSERRRQEERLSWEATHDALTQLLNRRAFMAAMVKALGDADKQPVPSILMMIDLDHFKPVNDQGGHLVGDDLLKRLADLFRASVRASDSVARLGGDEFAVLLPACGMERAEALAETIRARVETLKVTHEGKAFGVTVCIGLTPVSKEDASPREVISRADEGCYLAKSGGRNRVVAVPESGSA